MPECSRSTRRRRSSVVGKDGFLTLRLPTPGLFDHDQIEGVIAAARGQQRNKTTGFTYVNTVHERTPHAFPTLERRPRTTRKLSPPHPPATPGGVSLVWSANDDRIIEPSGPGTQLTYYHPMFDEYRAFLPRGTREDGRAKDERKRDKLKNLGAKFSRGAKNLHEGKRVDGSDGDLGGGGGGFEQEAKHFISMSRLTRSF